MFRRVVIPATKGVPSRGFKWMPDKEYRAKDCFYIAFRDLLNDMRFRRSVVITSYHTNSPKAN